MTISDTAPAATLVSYGSYIGGEQVTEDRWIYVADPRAVLQDSFATLTLKRRLDSGEQQYGEDMAGIVGRVAVGTDRHMQAALAAATRAAKVWRGAPLQVRVDDFLAHLGARILGHREQIEQMALYEGHPRELVKWEVSGWLATTTAQSRDFYRSQLWYETFDGDSRRIVRRCADGVVCINPPANAPMSSAMLAATSVMAGNAVVIRAPRSVPLGVFYSMIEIIAPVLEEIGAPVGTINVVCSEPAPTFEQWLDSPLVNDIMYFGAVEPGLEIERQCVAAGKKPILELAGNDVVVVWSDANLDYASDALLEAFFGSGQLCMIPNLVVAHPDIAEELVALVIAKAASIRIGYPDEDGVLLSPVLRHDKFHSALGDALDNGAQLLAGGGSVHVDGSPSEAGMFLQPTVIRVDGLKNSRRVRAVEHETFFPLLPIVVPDTSDGDLALSTVIDFVNTNLYGLRNSLWSSSATVIDTYVANVTNSGIIKVNESHIAFGAPLPTHGGTALTGGAFGEANYPALRTSHIQGVSVSYVPHPPRHYKEQA
ncbi:aldehyde dehydrogenase family protein [Mycobacteroides abscessus]|uniref:aldehyde dehydrogenase family protein n=1 Tax=Mycobacteroides abscessus TaxID=36809 RepID=UPI0002587C19|nr:aldehyde dehydrogenase [Mycobacteroides abscessus]EIC61809.1 aldehyde dehydrogenase [Mycobacteroides abscessus M93]